MLCHYRWSFPVVSLARQEVRACCRTPATLITADEITARGTDVFLNNTYLQDRRREHLLGISHGDCRGCLELEANGVPSKRTDVHEFKKYVDRAGMGSNWKTQVTSDHPEMLQILFENTCNLKCVYCGPQSSSAWEMELLQHGEMHPTERERSQTRDARFQDLFWSWFDQHKSKFKWIVIIGGEPLIQPAFYEFLDRLLADGDLKNRKIKTCLNITTNFCTPPKYFERMMSLLPQLCRHFDVSFEISLEALAEQAEYIRFGLNWAQFEKNVRTLLSSRPPMMKQAFLMSINSLCISRLPRFLDWLVELQNEYACVFENKQNIVSDPAIFNPLILTSDFSIPLLESEDIIQQQIIPHHNRWRLFLQMIRGLRQGLENQTGDFTPRALFADWVDKYDRRRQTHFVETFPEYRGFLELCQSLR